MSAGPRREVLIEKEHARCQPGTEPINESTVSSQTREDTVDLSLEEGDLLRKGKRAIDGFRHGVDSTN